MRLQRKIETEPALKEQKPALYAAMNS
jgi:hypothetical protein